MDAIHLLEDLQRYNKVPLRNDENIHELLYDGLYLRAVKVLTALPVVIRSATTQTLIRLLCLYIRKKGFKVEGRTEITL